MSAVVDILRKLGAVITDDHFVYTSGKHGEVYINKDALYPHPEYTSRVGKLFAEKYHTMDIDVVAAPALGGIILTTWTAYHLTQMKGKEVLGVYAEKMPDKSMAFTRGYDRLIAGKNVLVIEDLATTGGSLKKVVDLVRATGGNVVAACVMVNRDPEAVTTETIGAPFDSLGVIRAESWEESDLPDRIRKRPINTKVGHGKKYMEAKAAGR
ncbi:MAG: phosphoribosyltransferase family protein [Patescibacteria group bacterium]|nr:phosphoribosyltransferase family protein [Patescibacteria group bacterium]